ncbi:MAG: hypothetical protein WCG47_04640, partial [Dermatophilaceae bacterium]
RTPVRRPKLVEVEGRLTGFVHGTARPVERALSVEPLMADTGVKRGQRGTFPHRVGGRSQTE